MSFMVFQVNEIFPCETLQVCLVFCYFICKQNKFFRTIKYCTSNFYNWGNFLLSKWKNIQTTIIICLKYDHRYIQKIDWCNLKKFRYKIVLIIWRLILSLWKLYDEKGIVKKHIADNIRGIYLNLKITACDV